MPSSSLKSPINDNLEQFEKKVRIKFKNSKLLEEAFTHKSYSIENNGVPHNERMEFLGDSVISSVVAHYLYKKYPHDDEGKLSKMKSQIVSRINLTQWAIELQLGRYLFLSQGEEATGGRKRGSIVGNAYEALVGAIYLDQGYDVVQKFIFRFLSKKKRIIESDYKSRLQELIQKKYKFPPEYCVVKEIGPDHAKKFTLEVRVHKKVLGTGEGNSKKEAEQNAAKQGIKYLRNLKGHK